VNRRRLRTLRGKNSVEHRFDRGVICFEEIWELHAFGWAELAVGIDQRTISGVLGRLIFRLERLGGNLAVRLL
jgi:hypothetical protein